MSETTPLPSRNEALNLLAEVGCSPSVIEHCKLVAAFAVKVARACEKKQPGMDIELVEISALLHDIGRSRTHTVNHALEGGRIARARRLPLPITHAIERHAGGGISKEEARKLGWPMRDFLPKTLEEKIICYADKRVAGKRIVPIEQTVQEYAASLGKNHPTIKRILALHREITALAGEI